METFPRSVFHVDYEKQTFRATANNAEELWVRLYEQSSIFIPESFSPFLWFWHENKVFKPQTRHILIQRNETHLNILRNPEKRLIESWTTGTLLTSALECNVGRKSGKYRQIWVIMMQWGSCVEIGMRSFLLFFNQLPLNFHTKMGAPFASVMADIFMAQLETTLMDELKSISVYEWHRYVDDTFVLGQPGTAVGNILTLLDWLSSISQIHVRNVG